MSKIDEKHIQFLRMAKCVSERSKCASRKVGVVIVRNGCVISEGYNGAPKGVDMCQNDPVCMRRTLGYKSGEGLEVCPAVHAETNAIVQAAMNGVSVAGGTMYCYCKIPCKWCMGTIINSGISKIVCLAPDGTSEYDTLGEKMMREAGIEDVRYSKDVVDD
jgi:dCMP deaminase